MALAVVCTIGVPGSGKTTLCQALATSNPINNESCDEESLNQVRYILISFDDLQHHSASEFTAVPELHQADTALTPYKLFRRAVQSLIESLIRHIKTGEHLLLPERFNSPNLHHYLSSQLGSIGSGSAGSREVCMLLDDNMYYRSMRYPYYQLARKYGLGYGQMYFNTDIDVCVERNRHRHGEQRIDESVIVGMRERLQPPNPAVNAWEGQSLQIDGTSDALSPLLSFISSCMEHVVPTLMAASEDCERDARIGSDDVVHQSDLILRQLVKEYISSRPGGEEVKQSATKANRCRKSLLTHVRCHSAELSLLLSDTATTANQQSSLHQFIEALFSNELGKS